MTQPGRAVRVRVPATSANLGPGFDALGLGLTLYDEVEAEVTASGLTIEISGEGAEAATAGENHLVVRAMRAVFARAGAQPPGLRLRCVNAIPQGRGLGSSAGAVVAGVLAGRALARQADEPLAGGDVLYKKAPGEAALDHAAPDDTAPADIAPADTALAEASQLEGHPDNAAACLSGGLTIAWTPGGPGSAPRAIRLDPLQEIRPVVCVPSAAMPTAAARKALPATVPHADAAATAGRSALLVAALTQRPDLLFDATHDLLHEPYRGPLMPASADPDRPPAGGRDRCRPVRRRALGARPHRGRTDSWACRGGFNRRSSGYAVARKPPGRRQTRCHHPVRPTGRPIPDGRTAGNRTARGSGRS